MKYCPVRKVKILYIECLECDEKDMCEKLKEEERVKRNENRMSEVQKR